ncbi:NAD(P)H-dependent oxidoreductase [Streptomyces sp. PCS3-D2]|uniref:NADPH-dependent FMN reductase n=1 Tax=Streptomyces sp. PCS3-D2 TaxID=1460244 RepID=UPI0004485282|nr:NAD(P)H-dependent oxidoreductase [Streptomyces sp. PCS3-D2]WKV71868.1 NAD(P)H-dependent oxidoreductase [Streptomyces sp. PCS3-D2]
MNTRTTPPAPSNPLRVLGISGSLRVGSHNTAALRAVAAFAGPTVRFTLFEGLADIPPFCEDHEHPPTSAVEDLGSALHAADAVLIATPEYNSSVPGQLKNALDWASRPHGNSPLTGKTAALISASPSAYGARWAQEDLRRILTGCGANVADRGLAIPRADAAFGVDGLPLHPDLRSDLATLLDHLR